MAKRILRVYADTSVFGGVFDEEFSDGSRTFFDQVRAGRFLLIVSATVRDEIDAAPPHVKDLFRSLVPIAQVVETTDEAVALRNAYLNAGIVSAKSIADALHVASATTCGASLVVSWNFAHIVHFDKIPLYNGVNAANGYPSIAIYSPLEVIGYEDENF